MQREELERRQRERRRRKQKMLRRRRMFVAFILLLFIIVICMLTNGNKDNSAPQPELNESLVSVEETPEEIPYENPVLYPQVLEKPTDVLEGLKQKEGGKVAYLTFDDGPTKSVTPAILDVLRRYNVKATFFQVGTLIEDNPDMARRVYDEGHLIANHSYTHTYSKIYETEEGFITEVEKTFDVIEQVTNDPHYPRVFRFPGGGFDSGTWGENKQKYKETLKNIDVRYCDWNALNGDAEGGTPSAEELIERVKSSTENKNNVVILMHDANTKKTTVEALPAIIEYLISAGYTFGTLDQA